MRKQPERGKVRRAMRFIGITGGVGAGKSEILAHLAGKPGVKVMLADEIAHKLMEPGTDCYARLAELFAGEDVFLRNEEVGFDRKKLAAVIFVDPGKRARLNAVVHPAVKEYVLRVLREERERGVLRLLVLEAALLIEEHYDEICDELWYIYTDEAHRRERLMRSRGYSPEKITEIFASQLDEETYRSRCGRVIDNNGTIEETRGQIDRILFFGAGEIADE